MKGSGVKGLMLRHRTGYDRHDIHLLWKRENRRNGQTNGKKRKKEEKKKRRKEGKKKKRMECVTEGNSK